MSASMKGVLISGLDSGGMGGAEKITYEVCSRLRKYRFDTRYIVVAGSDFEKYLQKSGVRIHTISPRMDIVGNWRGFIKFFILLPLVTLRVSLILSKFKREGGKIVVLNGFSDKIILSPLAKLYGLKVVWVIHGPFGSLTRRCFGIPMFFQRLVSFMPHAVITPSVFTKIYAQKELKIDKKRFRLIENGTKIFNQKELRSMKKLGAKWRLSMNLEDKFVVGFVSRLEKGKGWELLIKAASRLQYKVPNLVSVIVGGGDLVKAEKMAVDYGVSDRCYFLGYLPSPYSVMSAFDVMAFPSTFKLEGFGLVSIEAMVLGVPLIATNFGPLPEVVGNAGLLIESNEKYLSEAILKLYRQPLLRKKLIIKAMRRVKRFDIEITARKYAQLFKTL